jgi:sortase A
MPKSKSPSELTVEELRWLLVQKRRAARQERIERYRRTGRVVMVTSDLETPSLGSWRTDVLEETGPVQKSRRRRVMDAILLLVEVSAVIGFIFILFNGLSVLQQLNRGCRRVGTAHTDPHAAHRSRGAALRHTRPTCLAACSSTIS